MRLIDADLAKEKIGNLDGYGVIGRCLDELPTVQAIPIPINATNAEVLKALFPKDMWKMTEDDAEWGNEPYEMPISLSVKVGDNNMSLPWYLEPFAKAIQVMGDVNK